MADVTHSNVNSASSPKSKVQDGAPAAPQKSKVQDGAPAASQKSKVQDGAPVTSPKSQVQDGVRDGAPAARLNSSMQELRVTSEHKSKVKYEPVVQTLVDWLERNNRMSDLDKSVAKALSYDIEELELLNINDSKSFLTYANKMLFWVPRETLDGKDVYYHIVMFYFVLNQPPLGRYQTPISPENVGQMSWLTRWLVDYALEIGKFCDSPESLKPKSLESFYGSPQYKMSNYIQPRGGWKTFNQFFAREFKPGYRTVYGLSDPTVIVSPADCTFSGYWNIDANSDVKLKHLVWSISDLLQGSRYASDFRGGIFTHSFLNTYDYHRLHTPVEGKVLESKVIQGQVYCETQVITGLERNSRGRLETVRNADAPNNPGYQFVQTRGLVVIDSPIGLVAVLPIGMATVSSVIMTADRGVTLRKGEEIGYFQFGGSDIVTVYQAKSKVAFTAVEGIHVSMGMPIGTAKVQP